MDKLQRLGFSDWFQSSNSINNMAEHDVARVISVQKDSYLVSKGDADVFAELTGKLLYSVDSAADLPTTGDWVLVDFYDDDSHAIIHEVMPRKSLLQRKASGKTIDYQLIASNIDVAFIVQSADENFNLSRLERYLVMVNESHITPVILLSKSDLRTPTELTAIIDSVVGISVGIQLIACSTQSNSNIDTIRKVLSCGKTFCLLGSSGVGKTSLLNCLMGRDTFATKIVSNKQSKGRHTTTNRQLVQLECGAMMIDTPGMRELGNISVDTGMDETFKQITALSMRCKFSNCQHDKEQGCAITAAIDKGELLAERYRNYLKMKNEADFNEMSFLEKKQKDKNFGKMIKSVMKNKNR